MAADAEILNYMEEYIEKVLTEWKQAPFQIKIEEFKNNITPEMANILLPHRVGESLPPESEMQEINDCCSGAAYQRAENLKPRLDGKQICKYLRQMRTELARANNIPFVSKECLAVEFCAGTCEQCDAEAAYLNKKMQEIAQTDRVYPRHILKKWGEQV